MKKVIFIMLQVMAWMAVTPIFFSCSDPEDSQAPQGPEIDDPQTPQEPENPNKVLAGQWSLGRQKEGQWVVDENGKGVALRMNHVFVFSSVDIYRDSSFVEHIKDFNLDYHPTQQTLTISIGDSVAETDIISIEPERITYAFPSTQDTVKMKKVGEYCLEAPDNIQGLYMSAQRFKMHGIYFGSNNEAVEYFYYPEVVDNIISEYEYSKGEGNKAHLSYHVRYRLNPDKVREETGVANYSDVTFDLTGELDLTFLSHVEGSQTNSEYYFGEMEGAVTAVVTNNKTLKETTTVVDGRRYFGLSSADDE